MATTTQLSGRNAPPRPPEKGSFPLDHFGDCKTVAEEYQKCMKENKNVTLKCRELAKKYLACRMNKGLMAKEEWNALGFRETDASVQVPNTKPNDLTDGYIAGVRKFERRKKEQEHSSE